MRTLVGEGRAGVGVGVGFVVFGGGWLGFDAGDGGGEEEGGDEDAVVAKRVHVVELKAERSSI